MTDDNLNRIKFDISQFRVDQELVDSGVWVDLGADASICIRSLDYSPFTDEFRKATKPYMTMGRDVPEDDQKAIMIRLVAKHIITDWKGIFDGDDELPYSVDNALRVLGEIDAMFVRVIAEARKVANFTQKAREDTAGN